MMGGGGPGILGTLLINTFHRDLSNFLRDLKTGSQARISRFLSPKNSVFSTGKSSHNVENFACGAIQCVSVSNQRKICTESKTLRDPSCFVRSSHS